MTTLEPLSMPGPRVLWTKKRDHPMIPWFVTANIRIKSFKNRFILDNINFRDTVIKSCKYQLIKVEDTRDIALILGREVSLIDNFNRLSNKQLIKAYKDRVIKRYSRLKKVELKTRLIE
jgi:hypothetical protein